MEGLKRQLRFQMEDSIKPFVIFWVIAILVDIAGYFANYYFGIGFGLMNNEAGVTSVNVAGGNIIAISIFFIVYNMVMYYESFPTAIGFSSTRRDFFMGVLVHNIMLCFGMALIQGILMKIDPFFVKLIGSRPVEGFGGINLTEANVITVSFILFLYFILFSSVFNLLGALLYKYTYKIWFVIAAIFIIIGNVGALSMVVLPALEDVFISRNIITDLFETLIIVPFFYLLSWLVIRRMNLRTSK